MLFAQLVQLALCALLLVFLLHFVAHRLLLGEHLLGFGFVKSLALNHIQTRLAHFIGIGRKRLALSIADLWARLWAVLLFNRFDFRLL